MPVYARLILAVLAIVLAAFALATGKAAFSEVTALVGGVLFGMGVLPRPGDTSPNQLAQHFEEYEARERNKVSKLSSSTTG